MSGEMELCPFCNVKASIVFRTPYVQVRCNCCALVSSSFYFSDYRQEMIRAEQEAIAHWNAICHSAKLQIH